MSAPSIKTIQAGDTLPERQLVCNTVQLFLYNAALWNAHRIHFDAPYAADVEGYPGLVVAGPLLGDWMSQCVLEWMGEAGQLMSFEFSIRRAVYVGASLVSGGNVVSVDHGTGLITLNLHIQNADREIIAPGQAEVRLPMD